MFHCLLLGKFTEYWYWIILHKGVCLKFLFVILHCQVRGRSWVSARLRNPQKHWHGSWQITFEDRFFHQEIPKGPKWFELAIFTSFCFRSPQISRSQSFRKQNVAPSVWPSFFPQNGDQQIPGTQASPKFCLRCYWGQNLDLPYKFPKQSKKNMGIWEGVPRK